jgi:hypothetical protein
MTFSSGITCFSPRPSSIILWYSAKIMGLSFKRVTKSLCIFLLTASWFLGGCTHRAQPTAAPPSAAPPPAAQPTPAPPPEAALPASAQPKFDNAEFESAADEVLKQVSDLTGLEQLMPLKKTLRSRDEIRAYVIREMDDEKNPAERYGETKSAEAFGLIPKGFDLDTFMVDLLTEQIAGLYDPKAREFYIADWIPLEDQRMVMAHELTHALQDQHFQIEAWVKAVRPNDDAELAREAVLEGSAMAAMIDYLLKGTGRKVEDLPDIDPSVFAGDLSKTPKLRQAPQFLKDALTFPYFAGLTFSAAILKPTGWNGLSAVFAKPPLSTQQIMHPALYELGRAPAAVTIPSIEKLLGPDWAKIDENVMGEFGWKEILKQFLDEERAKPVASAWQGDRYVLYQQKRTQKLVLVTRLRLDSEDHTERFWAEYSEALQKKYGIHVNAIGQPDFLSFKTPEGGVFLRCVDTECLSVEGTSQAVFDGINGMIGWPAVAATPKVTAATSEHLAHNPLVSMEKQALRPFAQP